MAHEHDAGDGLGALEGQQQQELAGASRAASARLPRKAGVGPR